MALSRDKAIIIGVVVLGGLSFLVYKQAQKDQNLGTAAAKADLPDVKGTDDLDKIELTNEKGSVTLQKEGETWMVMQPVHFPAAANNVKSMLDNFKEVKVTEVVASTADDDLKKSYNLDPAHAIHFVGSKGGDKKVDYLFGKSGGRGELMMVSGKPEILAASGFSAFLYGREAKEWRNHDIAKFEDANVASFIIDNKTGKFSCTKSDKWACTLNGAAIPGFDDSKPADALRPLKYLVAEDFPPPEKTVADTGLDKPESTITVAMKDGAPGLVLKVGNVSTGTSRFAMKDGDSTIYIVNPGVSDWATAKVDKFQKAAGDAGAPKAPTASAAKH